MTVLSIFNGPGTRRILLPIACFVAGLLACPIALQLVGRAVVDRSKIELLEHEIQQLQDENDRLFDELLSPTVNHDLLPAQGDLPYDGDLDARQAFDEARALARNEKKFLMVTFGANWCPDCRSLHRQLNSDVVRSYTADRFLFVNVNVGKFNQNIELAQELGVSLRMGVPVAIFFDPAGQVVGTTNNGELEPSRHYTSRQILKFVRDIAERSRIVAPDAVR